MDFMTDCWIQSTEQSCLTINYLDMALVRPDWFHYGNVVRTLS